MDTSLQHRLHHMARFLGYFKKDDQPNTWFEYDYADGKPYRILCAYDNAKDWRPDQNWDQLMKVYEKVCAWPRASEQNDYEDELVYIDRFEVGTNKIFISLWCVQPNGDFDFTNIYHGHSRLESVQGDCQSTKEMFFKSLSDFVTIVEYSKELYGN